MSIKIKLFGTERCHKCQYYKQFLLNRGLKFEFLDVEKNMEYAHKLRALYTNGRLNFPTLVLGDKKLRNPTEKELQKWIDKLK